MKSFILGAFCYTLGIVMMLDAPFNVIVDPSVAYLASAGPTKQKPKCNFLPVQRITGTVIHHKKSKPYPFKSSCDFWESKVKILVIERDEDGEYEEYKYKGYIVPVVTQCVRKGQDVACKTIAPGERIACDYETKEDTPLRGRLSNCSLST